MNKYQQKYVEAVLHQAFVDGRQFDDIDQVEAFFRENSVPADFDKNSRDIFNIFLRVKARSRLPLTPDGSNLGSTGPPSGEAQPDGDRCDADVSPTFTDEDPYCISFWVARADEFKVASARRCLGKECFMSRDVAELNRLDIRDQRVLLKWHPTGRRLVPFWQTWYRIVDQQTIEGCEVAIGEECSTQDHDLLDSDEIESSEDATTEELVTARSRDLAVYDSQPTSQLDEAEFEQTLARLNMYSALNVVNAKRKAAPPAHAQSSSQGSKRHRTSLGGSSAQSMQSNARQPF
ncbi:hypothetical protein JX266_009476 [Neoarthrinium moseri]|nr:hypothetical protein JX266_009476 [Neoarthrinium moseri]